MKGLCLPYFHPIFPFPFQKVSTLYLLFLKISFRFSEKLSGTYRICPYLCPHLAQVSLVVNILHLVCCIFWKLTLRQYYSSPQCYSYINYLILAVLGLRCCCWFSLAVLRGLLCSCRLLVAVASLAAEHGF